MKLTALILCLTGAGLAAQGARFEVASIRPSTAEGFAALPRIRPLPGNRLHAVTTLRGLIQFAYGLESYHRIEGPMAALELRYEVQALAPNADPSTGNSDSMALMLRTLLAERFHLVVRHEQETQTVSALRRRFPDRLGRGLRPSDAPCLTQSALPVDRTASRLERARAQCSIGAVNGEFAAVVADMPKFARALSHLLQSAVVDETGLAGPYEMEMRFNPATLTGRYDGPGGSDFPAFNDALRDELGLVLVQQRRTMPVLVVERVGPLTEN